jgi:uncharacterized repeat protein (TIGR02543 family)
VTANFTTQNYDLTMAVSPSGGGTTTPAGGTVSHPAYEVVNITATPATGYAFDHWTSEVASASSASTTVTVTAAKTVTAVFLAVNHTLTMAANPSGGGTTDPAVGGHTYLEGTVVYLTATPNIGYVFSNWTGGVTGTTNPTSVTMSADKTVTANFTAQNYDLTMAVSPSGGGTTTPAAGAHSYGVNSVVNISAAPAAGYVFDHWTGDVASSTSASTTVTVTAAKTVTAVFVVVNHTLTMAASPSGGGTTDPSAGDHSYQEGSVVNLTATPAVGYVFSNWTGGVTGTQSALGDPDRW